MKDNGMKRQGRQTSQSPDSQPEKQYERSRQKKNKVQYKMGPDLHLTKHYYFVIKKQTNIGYPFAVWNFCILYGKKPAICLIVCENESQIYQILQFKKLGRKIAILADHDRQSIKNLIQNSEIQVLLLTNKKASILSGLEEALPCFSLIINVGFHKDVEGYRKLHDFLLKTGGIIISFIEHRRDIQRIERQVTVNFNQVDGNISKDQINKQIISQIQFLQQPKPQTISMLKMLPFTSEQTSARLFQLFQKQYINTEKSKHLNLIGYLTYQVKTDVQFNSFKYIWNYLKDIPESISENVRNMVKFRNRKGVVFNIPLQLRYEMDHYIRKMRKHQRDNNKYQISIVYQMPEIEDVGSQEYRQVEQKKNFAMKHKQDLEIFVGGLPFKVTQQQIRSFFLQNNVNPLTIRIMRNKEGESKGICFMLCEDEEHVKRCLKLDDTKFGDRTIRVHMADKRQKR